MTRIVALAMASTSLLLGCGDPNGEDGASIGDESASTAQDDGSGESDDEGGSTGDTSGTGETGETGTTGGGDYPPDFPDTSQEDRQAILELMEAGGIPGMAACLVKDGQVAWCDGFGVSDMVRETPVTYDTPFLLASTTKAVTAVAILQQRDEDALDLDQDVDEILPFVVDHPQSATPITLRRLLSHTAGIRDDWPTMGMLYGLPTEYGAGGVWPYSLGEAMQGYFEVGGQFYSDGSFLPTGPGVQWMYANMGVALAGYVAEVAANRDLADLCAERIFEPLKMYNTAFRWEDLDGVEVAWPYDWVDGQGYTSLGHYTFSDYPDGALRSSAYDMARFLAAVSRGGELNGVRIIDEASLVEIIDVQYPQLHPDWGLSMFRHEFNGDWWIGHGGDVPDSSSDMYFRPDDGLGYVIVRNFRRGTYDDLLKTHLLGMADALP